MMSDCQKRMSEIRTVLKSRMSNEMKLTQINEIAHRQPERKPTFWERIFGK